MMVRRQQSGIALITVLLILSLATVAAVSMTTRQQLDIRRTTNILRIEQAYMALLAAEESVKRLLIEDANRNLTDSSGDIWNDKLVRSAVQKVGEFTVTNFVIEDLQGRFNINNLVQASRADVSLNDHRAFVRLLGLVGLRDELADAAYDWIDNAPAQYEDGAEDDAYSGLEKPYLTPNLDMASASEMYRLKDVNLPRKDDSDESHKTRRDIIRYMLQGDDQTPKVLIALPQRTPINVNMPASPKIFEMIIPRIDKDDAQDLYDRTQSLLPGAAPAFTDADAFWTDPRATPLVATADRVNISFDSHYFLLSVEAFNGDLVVYSNTIFYRTGTGNSVSVRVVHRSYGREGEI